MTVLAYSEDPVAAAKVVEAYAKDNEKLVVLGGAMGETALDPAGVKAVAAMPSRDELSLRSWVASLPPLPTLPVRLVRLPRISLRSSRLSRIGPRRLKRTAIVRRAGGYRKTRWNRNITETEKANG